MKPKQPRKTSDAAVINNHVELKFPNIEFGKIPISKPNEIVLNVSSPAIGKQNDA